MSIESRAGTSASNEGCAVLVLGMHRGGTSVLAGLLHLSGFELGSAPMQAAPGVNSKGFFEHAEAHAIHERLLLALGRSRFDPREMPVGWRKHPAFAIAVEEVRALIERDFAGTARWLVKDPRLCRIVPIWLEAMASLGIAPRVIVIARHPAEVGGSMQAQHWIASIARAHLCWLQHMLEAEASTRGITRTLVVYDALIADWRSERARIGRALGIEWPDAIDEASIDAFVSAQERHFDASRDALAGSAVPALAAELYDAFRGGDDAWSRIAALGETYARGAAAFGPCLDEAIVEASLASSDATIAPLVAVVDGVASRLDAIEASLANVAERAGADATSGETRSRALLEAQRAAFERIDAMANHLDAVAHRCGALWEQSAEMRRLADATQANADAAARVQADALRAVQATLAEATAEIARLRAAEEARFSFGKMLRGKR